MINLLLIKIFQENYINYIPDVDPNLFYISYHNIKNPTGIEDNGIEEMED